MKNSKNRELYAVFPYRLFGVGKPQLEIALKTYNNRRFKGTGCWQQDAIHAAILGLTDQAAAYVVENFSTKNVDSRFPAFWGPNSDWTPDQDHGNVAMIALQRMLIQSDGANILLFPAWPKQWNVSFRLNAPQNTIVEGVYENGQLPKKKIETK